jgi:GxxExxY protein
LLRELRLRGISASSQTSLTVQYKGAVAGEYFADLVVEDQLVVELKCVDRLGNAHAAQCMSYLRGSGRNVCLLVNFNRPKVEWMRVLYGVELPERA